MAMESNERDVPPSWSYNPSAWNQRIPILLLAAFGFAIAMYLSLYQWRVVEKVWEPFFSPYRFGGGSEQILLESGVSKKTLTYLGVPDAFLGALAYLADAITGAVGSRERWRSLPWMVIIFGLLIGPLGAISIILVIIQPVLYQAWCTLCLASAVISVLMIGPAMDEFLASLQHLKKVHIFGGSVWRAFWGLD